MSNKEKKESVLLKNMLETEQELSKQSGEKAITEEEICLQKKKATRKMLLRFLFIIISFGVIALIFLTEFQNENVQHISEILKNIGNSSRFLYFALIAVILMIFFQSARMTALIFNFSHKFRPILGYKTSQIGRYYDNLTPSGIGGQPSQILYLRKNGLPTSEASGITVTYFIATQFAFILLGVVLFISNGKILNLNIGAIGTLGYVGLVVNALFPTFILIISIIPNVGLAIVRFIFNLLEKVKIIKHDKRAKKQAKAEASLLDYSEKLTFMFRNFFKLFLPQLILALCEVISFAAIAFFVMKGFGLSAENKLVDVITLYMYVYFASSLMPTPGMTGGAEFVFVNAFSKLLDGTSIFWSMLLWRIATFYFYIIQGFAITLYDSVKQTRRLSKQVEKLNEEEQENNQNEKSYGDEFIESCFEEKEE